jgi:hypothetical protein
MDLFCQYVHIQKHIQLLSLANNDLLDNEFWVISIPSYLFGNSYW